MCRPRSAREIFLVLGVNGLAELGLFVTTLLREMPEFWRNAGGYPVFLRELVYIVHYPLLVVVLGGLAAGSLLSLRCFATQRGLGAGLLMVAALQWLLFVLILVIMLWNNVDNVLHGRPPHYHAPLG